MREERMAEALAAHVDGGGSRPFAGELDDLAEGEHTELTSLVQLANHLEMRMQLLQAPPAFVRSLREELVKEAERRMVERRRRRRLAVIGGAAAGVVVSIASLVGGIVVLIKWLRTRTQAQQASTA